MSTFAAALEQAGPPDSGRQCRTCAWFEKHPEEREAVESAYRQADNRAHIWRVFNDTFSPGFSDSAFHNHFRRGHDA